MEQLTREQLEILVKLQEIETNSNKIRADLTALPRKLNSLEIECAAVHGHMENEVLLLNDLKKQYRSYENEVQTLLDRAKKSQQKLSSVKTNKEYQASLKEIEDLKAKSSQIEDAMLECLDRMEDADKRIEALKEDHSALSKQIEQEKDRIRLESEEAEKTLFELEQEGLETAINLDPELRNQFEIVKNQQPGRLAVVPVSNSVCLGCHMNIPPQMYNELQRFNSLKFCPFCQRIIYWKEA